VTRPKRGEKPGLEELVADAFAAKHELIPTTEAEVKDAERRGVEFEGALPASLEAYRPKAAPVSDDPDAGSVLSERAPPTSGRVDAPAGKVRRLGRSAWLTHLIAAALGAAAAAALLIGRGPGPDRPLPTGEPAKPRADAAPKTVAIPAVLACSKPCCAGSQCREARDELKSCASERRCIACTIEALSLSRYRIRLGAFASGARVKRIVDGGGALELCARAGSSELACAPAHAAGDQDEQWTLLPLVVSTQDMLAGFELALRQRGSKQPLGAWKNPVTLNATVLCKGLLIKPKDEKEEVLGTVSVFLEDTHYVELMRSDSVERLLEARFRLSFVDATPRIFETRKTGADHFALVLGPFDKPTAERLRWALLDKGESARLVIGEDHVGPPRHDD
jgi:hypothetical protein